MPRGDKTGPNGQGSRTGRGLGYCNGYDSPGYYEESGFMRGGRGYGRNAGRGNRAGFGRRGFANNFDAQGYREVSPVLPEKAVIENEMQYLKAQVEMLEKRLNEISKPSKD